MTIEATDTSSSGGAPTSPAPYGDTATAPSRRSSSWALVLALVLVAFIGGIVLSIFGPQLAERWLPAAPPAVSVTPPSTPVPQTVIAPHDATTLEGRVAALSARLDTLAIQAQNASSFATRAESLMIAFAARRSLDSGTALGYIENELRTRFGDEQPKAVATIISAAQEPVTLSDLQAGLEDATPALIGNQTSGDWWTAARRELSNMVIIRRAGSPSRVPQKAIEQARALLVAGRVDAAMAEVERLPGRHGAELWLEQARRYNEARRALDIIEAAAILEPRIAPATETAPSPAAAVPASAENAATP